MHFQAEIKGEIQIKFRREKIGECINHREESKIENYNSNSFILIVSDDGVGVPENLGIGDIERLGFQLVASLMDQLELDGELELKRKYGTEFTMNFPVNEKTNRQLSLTAMPITFDFIHQVRTIRRVQNNYQNFWYNLAILSLKIWHFLIFFWIFKLQTLGEVTLFSSPDPCYIESYGVL